MARGAASFIESVSLYFESVCRDHNVPDFSPPQALPVMLPPLVDICFNFTHESFRQDEAELIQRALIAGVEWMVVTGSTLAESKAGMLLCHQYPKHLVATAGVHPHHASEWQRSDLKKLLEMAKHDEVRAIGECGLDYNRDYSPREAQRYAFEAQLEAAATSGLPAFLHERDAHEDFLTLVERYLPDLSAAVVHCFTGEGEQLDAYLELGLHVGITGWICDERRGHHLRELVERIPADKLMIETDAPYLLPRDLPEKPKGRRNEPSHLPHICKTVAECRGESAEATAEATTKTASRFFRLDD